MARQRSNTYGYLVSSYAAVVFGWHYRHVFTSSRRSLKAASGTRRDAAVLDGMEQPVGKPTTLQFHLHQRVRRAGEQSSEGTHNWGQPSVDQFHVAFRVVVEPAKDVSIDLALGFHS